MSDVSGIDLAGLGLAGRRVLVTGGSRGIGAACCRLFARAGASVAVAWHRSGGAAAALVEELFERAPDGHHLSLHADLATADGAATLVGAVERDWGGLDCLVNNAGLWLETPLGGFDPAVHERLLAVNLDAPFRLVAAAAPLLAASDGDPSIVGIASTAGQRGEAGYSSYAASKGGLISATKSWAVELAPRVRVNAVAPGWVDTDMVTEALAGRREAVAAEIPSGRVATAEDVAGPVVFLASTLARHVTGEILNVNGGSVLVG